MDFKDFMEEMERRYSDGGFAVHVRIKTSMGEDASYKTDGMLMLCNANVGEEKTITVTSVGSLNMMDLCITIANFIRRESSSTAERRMLQSAFLHAMEGGW